MYPDIYSNKFFKCTYVHLYLFHSKSVQHVHSTLGLLTHNATWCQNRGCICISSIRRTYGRIHAISCIHPVIQTSTIILQTELFPKKRREKIQGEILQSSNTVFPHIIQHSTRTSVFPHAIQSSRAKKTILHTELILLQEFSKKYYNYKAHPMQIDTRHPPTSVPCASKQSTWQNKTPMPLQYMQASSNSTRRKSILSGSQHPRNPYKIPQVHFYRILQGEIGFFQIGSSITYHCNTTRSVCSNLLLLALRIILQEI